MRAQVAMESLMTYAWAVLVVAAVIGILAYYGVFTANKFTPDRCIAQVPFACDEFRIYPDGNVSVLLHNTDNVDLSNATMRLTCSAGAAPSATTGTGTSIKSGDRQNVTFACPPLSVGMSWNGNFSVEYMRAGDLVTHTAVGDIRGHVE